MITINETLDTGTCSYNIDVAKLNKLKYLVASNGTLSSAVRIMLQDGDFGVPDAEMMCEIFLIAERVRDRPDWPEKS